MDNSCQYNNIRLLGRKISRTINSYIQRSLTNIKHHWNTIGICFRSLLVKNHIRIKLPNLTKLMISPDFVLLLHWVHCLLMLRINICCILIHVLRHKLLLRVMICILTILWLLVLRLLLRWLFLLFFFIVSEDFTKHFYQLV